MGQRDVKNKKDSVYPVLEEFILILLFSILLKL